MNPKDLLVQCTGFDWDVGNLRKNWESHRVSFWEAEEVFMNGPLLSVPQRVDRGEERFYCLGETEAQRFLFVVFTVRADRIRVISARDMSRKERRIYKSYATNRGTIRDDEA